MFGNEIREHLEAIKAVLREVNPRCVTNPDACALVELFCEVEHVGTAERRCSPGGRSSAVGGRRAGPGTQPAGSPWSLGSRVVPPVGSWRRPTAQKTPRPLPRHSSKGSSRATSSGRSPGRASSHSRPQPSWCPWPVGPGRPSGTNRCRARRRGVWRRGGRGPGPLRPREPPLRGPSRRAGRGAGHLLAHRRRLGPGRSPDRGWLPALLRTGPDLGALRVPRSAPRRRLGRAPLRRPHRDAPHHKRRATHYGRRAPRRRGLGGRGASARGGLRCPRGGQGLGGHRPAAAWRRPVPGRVQHHPGRHGGDRDDSGDPCTPQGGPDRARPTMRGASLRGRVGPPDPPLAPGLLPGRPHVPRQPRPGLQALTA